MNKVFFIVDDDPFFCKLIQGKFSENDVIVKSFSTGEECLKSLDEDPDLIILDYIFSSVDTKYKDGMAIFDAIKEYSADIPVIMLSGQEDGEIVLALARKGVSDYVVKDKDVISALEEAISNVMLDNSIN